MEAGRQADEVPALKSLVSRISLKLVGSYRVEKSFGILLRGRGPSVDWACYEAYFGIFEV